MAAQVGANAQGFFSQMEKVEQEAKATARTVNSTKASLKVQADTKRLAAASTEVDKLAAKTNAKRAAIPVSANVAPAKRHIEALRNQAAMKPITLSMALVGAALMRALTQSEKGKELVEQIDKITLSVLEPLLANLVPAVTALVPVAQSLGDAISQLNRLIPTIPGAGGVGGISVPTTGAAQMGTAATFFTNLRTALSSRAYWENREAISLSGLFRPASTPRPAGAPAAPPRAPVGPQTWAAAASAAAGGITNFATMMQGMQSQLAGGGFQAQIASMNTAMATAEADILRIMQINRDLFPVPVANAMNAVLEAQLRNVRSQVQAQQDKLVSMNREVTIMNRLNSMRAQAEQLNAAALSPLEVFTNRMAELDRLMTAPGGAGLTQAGFNTAAAAAFTQLQASIGTGPTSGPAALSAQSIEAQQAINAAMRQNMQPDIQTQIRDAVRAAAVDAATTAARAADIAKGIDRLGVVGLARTR